MRCSNWKGWLEFHAQPSSASTAFVIFTQISTSFNYCLLYSSYFLALPLICPPLRLYCCIRELLVKQFVYFIFCMHLDALSISLFNVNANSLCARVCVIGPMYMYSVHSTLSENLVCMFVYVSACVGAWVKARYCLPRFVVKRAQAT